ncbi:FixH family protein [Brevibacillus choshinensis]|uniref:FixH family protein n=1 Tax=Brevibacillus choshinensis TaxID=54911 RepID=A0ABX7FTD2_BRECH|nr:FixH family protein [Brevibacillus choshinensis]QRG69493.1 FixH family protein [Brevibacillus choshinensis]
MKRYVFPLLCLLCLLATACGKDNQEAALPSSEPIDAAFSMLPANPAKGETITFSVKVTQNGSPVDDAKEVKFEWWKDGQEQHVTIPATLQADGVYTAVQSIGEPGSYYVYYHVTARDFHNMQKVAFTVGDGQQASDTGTGGTGHPGHTQTPAAHDHGSSGDSASADHPASKIDFHFMPPESVKAADSAIFTVHLMRENQSFSQATVKFEFWQGNEEKHTFVDATETQPGQYSADAALPTAGSYTVNVHVEKGDVHDHKSFPLSVQ